MKKVSIAILVLLGMVWAGVALAQSIGGQILGRVPQYAAGIESKGFSTRDRTETVTFNGLGPIHYTQTSSASRTSAERGIIYAATHSTRHVATTSIAAIRYPARLGITFFDTAGDSNLSCPYVDITGETVNGTYISERVYGQDVTRVVELGFTAANSTAYTVVIQGYTISITSDGSATVPEIAVAMTAAINAHTYVNDFVIATDNATRVTITGYGRAGADFTLTETDSNITTSQARPYQTLQPILEGRTITTSVAFAKVSRIATPTGTCGVRAGDTDQLIVYTSDELALPKRIRSNADVISVCLVDDAARPAWSKCFPGTSFTVHTGQYANTIKTMDCDGLFIEPIGNGTTGMGCTTAQVAAGAEYEVGRTISVTYRASPNPL